MMAIPLSIAGPGALLGTLLALPPSLVLLAMLTVAVVAVIYAYQPPLPQTTVFAFLAWVVVGSLLNALAAGSQYPPALRPLVTGPGAYLTAIFVPGVVWMALLNLAVTRRGLPPYHHYLTTMGLGVVLVLGGAVLVDAGPTDVKRLLVLVAVPLIALLATGIVSFSIALWAPDFIDYTAISGAFVVFGAFVYGIGTAAGATLGGTPGYTPFPQTIRSLVQGSLPNGMAGVGVAHLWVWALLLASLAVGIPIATQLAPYADTRPRSVQVLHSLVGVVGFALGFNHLLALVVG